MKPTSTSRVLRLESLEPRIVPSTLIITPGDTATTLIRAGDTGEDALGNVILEVSSGAALVFVNDDGDGVYQSGELKGLALADGTRIAVFDVVDGDIATNLDADGTLSDGTVADDGTALLASSIDELNIVGSARRIFVGQDISNVQVEDVTAIRTGTAAGERTFNFGSGNLTTLGFTPGDGEDGGNITNVSITNGTALVTLALGNGGNSAAKNGGDGGDLDNVTIINNGNVTVVGGKGGDGFKRGGDGSDFDNFSITTDLVGFGASNAIEMNAGGGGIVLDLANAKGRGGAAGDFSRGELSATGDVAINATGGDGGNGAKQGGSGSSIEEVSSLSTGAIILFATDGGNTPDGVNFDGAKGKGGAGGQVAGLPEITASGDVSISGGSGGSGGRLGGEGGGVSDLDITTLAGAVTIVGGNGASFDSSTGSEKGKGGKGGGINSVLIECPGSDVSLTSGNGGGGNTRGSDAGSIDSVGVTAANSVTFLGGNGGGNAVNITRGGDGGSIVDAVISADGDVMLTAGNGGEADDDLPDDNPNIRKSTGGDGGIIERVEVTGLNIALHGGAGGNGISGGGGGLIEEVGMTVLGEANVIAGDGGTTTVSDGGDGGDVTKIEVTGAGFVRAIVAGNGGSATALGGQMGNGGSIDEVTFNSGTIGDFAATYGTAGMGGLFAGDGSTTGKVTKVTAGLISNIVASDASNPVLAKAASSIDDILATGGDPIVIGSDTDDDGAFDFADGAVNGVYDPSIDAPTDGLVLAEALGTITGTTLFTLETSSGTSTGTIEPN